VLFFVVQRGDCRQLAPADDIDPDYGILLRQAKICGVEILAYVAKVTPKEIKLSHPIPIILD
jgi:sugar fermentation stimulation protein A